MSIYTLRSLVGMGACLVLAFGTVSAAYAEEADDLIVNGSNASGLSIAPLDPGTPIGDLFNRRLNPTQGYDPNNPFLGVFSNDTGFDMFPGIDLPDPYDTDGQPGYDYPLSQVKIEQVSISPGLFAIYDYDPTIPVFGIDGDRIDPNTNAPVDYRNEWFLSDTPLSPGTLPADGVPLYFHQHFQFYADTPGVYQFQFRLTDALLVNGGGSLPNSGIYTINYVAGVPEPGSVALLIGAGIGGLMLRRRQQKRNVRHVFRV
jgi:hypothetical protein